MGVFVRLLAFLWFVTVSTLTSALMCVYQHYRYVCLRASACAAGVYFSAPAVLSLYVAACSPLSVCSLWLIACQTAAEHRSHRLTETLSHQSRIPSRFRHSSGNILFNPSCSGMAVRWQCALLRKRLLLKLATGLLSVECPNPVVWEVEDSSGPLLWDGQIAGAMAHSCHSAAWSSSRGGKRETMGGLVGYFLF